MPGPFDGEPKEPRESKVTLKQVSSQKSMFDEKPKRPSQQEFQQQVQASQEKSSSYKKRASDLAVQFAKTMSDKTLPENKGPFVMEARREMLQNMVQLAKDINNDPNEEESDGSIIWIIVLFNTCLDQRDRINQLEYTLSKNTERLESSALSDFISKEITRVLDAKKVSG
jgi:hypothetical protein